MEQRIRIVQGDITRVPVDALVNAANEALLPGSGVCGAIHRAAGPGLAAFCRSVAPCPTGEARLTPGFALPVRFVVHAVGPVWRGGVHGEASLLASCYRNALELAGSHGAADIAFPCISTGVYGYPRRAAADVAVAAVRTYLADHALPRTVLLCAFGAEDAEVLRAALAGPPGGPGVPGS